MNGKKISIVCCIWAYSEQKGYLHDISWTPISHVEVCRNATQTTMAPKLAISVNIALKQSNPTWRILKLAKTIAWVIVTDIYNLESIALEVHLWMSKYEKVLPAKRPLASVGAKTPITLFDNFHHPLTLTQTWPKNLAIDICLLDLLLMSTAYQIPCLYHTTMHNGA